MTDEYPRDPMEPPAEPPPMDEEVEEHRPETVLAGAGEFTSGEGLVAFAGLLIVAVWVIFAVIADEYGIDWTMLALAVAAAALPRLDRAKVERFHSLPVTMKVIGYGLALFGVFNLIYDLRFGVLDNIGDILGGLATYAASVMAFLGARQIKL
ncbi:MAG TPA: hypothetical protein VF115_01805 [Acidimicrobiia bacterium]